MIALRQLDEVLVGQHSLSLKLQALGSPTSQLKIKKLAMSCLGPCVRNGSSEASVSNATCRFDFGLIEKMS